MSDTSATDDKRKFDNDPAGTDVTHGEWNRVAGFTAGTTPSFEGFGLLSVPESFWKPPVKNPVVEKKIKRRGWSKQFFEK